MSNRTIRITMDITVTQSCHGKPLDQLNPHDLDRIAGDVASALDPNMTGTGEFLDAAESPIEIESTDIVSVDWAPEEN